MAHRNWPRRPGPRVRQYSGQAGFWTVVIGESNHDLYYLLEWESLAEREEKWSAFMADPEWLAKRAESEKDGPIVASLSNTILQPTGFSSVQ